jgi:N-acetyl-anhydromuramyl-L-alanine amidase AmpD
MTARFFYGAIKVAILLILFFFFAFLGEIHTAASQSPTQKPTPTPDPYECKTGENFEMFEADYFAVTQVCPAHKTNKDGKLDSKKIYIVIHNTDNPSATAVLGNIRAFQNYYSNPKERRSAHYLVGLNDKGEVQIIQLVRESDIAYHAGGVTKLNGQWIDNSNSIGIEVVGSGTLDGWPADAVYQSVAALVKDIIRRHKEQGQEIELNRTFIVGHEEISVEVKPDPGPNWDWQRFMQDELGTDYVPSVEFHSERNIDTNEVSLSVEARKSTRTHFQLEVSEDGGEFVVLSEIETNGKVANSPLYNQDSPQIIKLASYIPDVQEHPKKICYRAKTLRESFIYVNSSSTDCVIVGQPGFSYTLPDRDAAVVSQSTFPIVKPGQDVSLTFRIRNTGILSWLPGGRYVFINTGGETFGVETQLAIPVQIWTNGEAEFQVDFKAPHDVGAYTTRWQMAYMDPLNGIQLFGKETGGIVTVLPEGNTGKLEEIVQTIIDSAVQSANQRLEDYLSELRQRIQDELEKEFRNRVLSICPPLAPLFGLVISGALINRSTKRRLDGKHE